MIFLRQCFHFLIGQFPRTYIPCRYHIIMNGRQFHPRPIHSRRPNSPDRFPRQIRPANNSTIRYTAYLPSRIPTHLLAHQPILQPASTQIRRSISMSVIIYADSPIRRNPEPYLINQPPPLIRHPSPTTSPPFRRGVCPGSSARGCNSPSCMPVQLHARL